MSDRPDAQHADRGQQGFYPTLEKAAVVMAAFGIVMFLLETLGWLPW